LGVAGRMIQLAWFASGILLIYLNVRKTKKLELSDIIVAVLGPIAWTSVLAIRIYDKHTKVPEDEEPIKTQMKREFVIILSWIPWLILGAWFTLTKLPK